MHLTSWLDSLKTRFDGRRHGRRRWQASSPIAAQVESLEQRLLLSATFRVDSTADTVDANPGDGIAQDAQGRTTLRAAIMEANSLAGFDIIELNPGTYTLNRAGRNEDLARTGDLDIRDALTILGVAGEPSETRIDANGLDRVFDVLPGFSFAVRSLTIQNGNATDGIFTTPEGGAIRNRGATLFATDTHFVSNQTSGLGGAIYNFNSGQLNILRSRFAANNADSGGAFYIQTGSKLFIRDSIISSTAAKDGGGIYNHEGSVTIGRHSSGTTISSTAGNSGGGIYNDGGSVIVENSRFDTSSAGMRGGAIYNETGEVQIKQNVTFTDNKAAGAGDGGAISSFDSLIIRDSTFSRNSSTGDGGAIHIGAGTAQIFNSTLTSNSATNGGAIATEFAGHAEVLISNSMISENSAGFGGGIYNVSATLTITNSTLSENQATSGGGLYNAGGGGPTTINRSTFSGNRAGEGFRGDGGAIYAAGTIEIENSTVSGNKAFTVTPEGHGLGGGIYVANGGTRVTVSNTTITQNTAQQGGGVSNTPNPESFKPKNTIIAGNSAATIDPDLQGTIVSRGANLIGDVGTAEVQKLGTDQIGTSDQPIDPLLASLADNGGPSQTHALLPGSSAIDTGTDDEVAATDQRGRLRIVDGNADGDVTVDIGAFEVATPEGVHGRVYHDVNGNGVQVEGEPGLAEWTIFLDTNDNGILDDSERSITTLSDNPVTRNLDESGLYSIRDVADGNYTVTQELKAGFQQTFPENGTHPVNIGFNKTVTGRDFGNRAVGQILQSVEVLQQEPGDIEGAKKVNGLGSQAFDVAVSPDGKHVYVTQSGEELTAFARDVTTGELTPLQILQDANDDDKIDGATAVVGLGRPRGVTVSLDGKNVYVAGFQGDSLSVLSRDPDTGLLTALQVFLDEDSDNEVDGAIKIQGLDDTTGVEVSPDGQHVYATSEADNSVVVFSRDQQTGALTYVETIRDDSNGVDGLDFAREVAISPDNQHVYVLGGGDDAVTVFRRDVTSGRLNFIEVHKDNQNGVDGLDFANSIAISPDGNFLYIGGRNDNGIAVFQRDAASGELSFVEFVKDGVNGVDGLATTRAVVASPNSQFLYAAGEADDAVVVFERNLETGELTFVEAFQEIDNAKIDSSDGGSLIPDATKVAGLNSATWIAVSPDGETVYVTTRADTLTVFERINNGPPPVEPPPVDPLARKAFELDQEFGLEANSTFNWGGASEKWRGSASGTWYFITPDGKFYEWTGSQPGANFVSGSKLVATLDSSYYSDVSKLHDAQEPTAPEPPPVEPPPVDPLAQKAFELDQELGLEANSTFNWGGASEKWLGSASGTWYFITPDGKFYEWTGSQPGANFVSGSKLVATLDPSYYNDPSKLYDAPEPDAVTLATADDLPIPDLDDFFSNIESLNLI